LIDIVSKNGDLLLNISPKSDGTIPEEQQKILLNIGRWLKQNGEAIYGTRPWRVFGEGPTRLEKGGAFTKDVSYTPQDIRYTRKEDTVYAIEMGWPGPHQKILLESWHRDLHWGANIKIRSISALGSDEQIRWAWPAKGLIITTPSNAPNNVAVVFRIVTRHF
jgi:alpha-L-fucosidase